MHCVRNSSPGVLVLKYGAVVARAAGVCPRRGNRTTCCIAYREAHMAHRLQLCRQGLQKLLRRQFLMHEVDCVADQQFGKAHRCRHFNSGLHAGARDQHATRDEHGEHVDQNEHEQKLSPDRVPVPECVQQTPRQR